MIRAADITVSSLEITRSTLFYQDLLFRPFDRFNTQKTETVGSVTYTTGQAYFLWRFPATNWRKSGSARTRVGRWVAGFREQVEALCRRRATSKGVGGPRKEINDV